MESAHLTKAHEHVRNAATATYSNSVASAGAEHELAASAFHDALKDTHNAEALRILGLLQDHHIKLARLIKEPPRKKEKPTEDASQSPESPTTSPPAKSASARTTSPSPSTTSPTPAPSRRRLPQSSIASNLAEKRGIPGARRGTPSASSVSVTNALATRNDRPSTPVRDLLQRQSRKADEASKIKEDVPNSPPTDQKRSPVVRDVSPPPDDNFRRFYSAFGGVISAISAPLAFTSLPLNPTAAPPAEVERPPSPTKQKQKAKPKTQSPEGSRTIKSSEPDLAALVSKPALRALREDRNAALGPFANNESFYLVPTSGGTTSYANILRDPQAHPHHAAQDPNLDSIAEGDNENGLRGSSHEEFVDARESVGPPSPTAPRRPRSKGSTSAGGVTNARDIRAGRGTGLKTMEELQLENDTLRSLIDKQSKRLSMWETTSQSSYNALAQSFRARGAAGTLNKQMSDPSALAQALAMGANAIPPSSPPATTTIAQHHQQISSPPISPLPSPHLQTAEQAEAAAQAQAQASRIADLESRLAGLETENAQLARQNEKNTLVIGRYREQWEKLKAGARKKEMERRERRGGEVTAAAAAASAAVSSKGSGVGVGVGEDGKAEKGGGVGEEENGDGDKDMDKDKDGEGEEVVEEPGFGKA